MIFRRKISFSGKYSDWNVVGPIWLSQNVSPKTFLKLPSNERNSINVLSRSSAVIFFAGTSLQGLLALMDVFSVFHAFFIFSPENFFRTRHWRERAPCAGARA